MPRISLVSGVQMHHVLYTLWQQPQKRGKEKGSLAHHPEEGKFCLCGCELHQTGLKRNETLLILSWQPSPYPHQPTPPYANSTINKAKKSSLKKCQNLARTFLYPNCLLSGLATTWCPPPLSSHHQMHESFVLRGFCALMLYSYGFCMTSRYRHETRPSVTSSELVYTLYTVYITLYTVHFEWNLYGSAVQYNMAQSTYMYT